MNTKISPMAMAMAPSARNTTAYGKMYTISMSKVMNSSAITL